MFLNSIILTFGSWEWYDHDHDGTPRVCRIQLHCTDTLQLQVLGNGTITATTAPLVFVEYNYIVPTLHLTAAGSWEWSLVSCYKG